MKKLFVVGALCAISSISVGRAAEVSDKVPCVSLREREPNAQVTEACVQTPAAPATHAILEFFSITCSSCLDSLPTLRSFAVSVSALATTRLVAIDRDLGAVESFALAQNLDVPLAYDNDRAAKHAFDVMQTPTLFVLDAQGTVIYKHVGPLDAPTETELRALIGAAPRP